MASNLPSRPTSPAEKFGSPEQQRAMQEVVLGMTPGIGDAMAVRDAYYSGKGALADLQAGQYGRGALGVAETGLNAMGALPMLPAMGGIIKAYHGSPHRFDKFSMEKIGTGEGANNEGFGLNFAEDPNVGRRYQMAATFPTIEGRAIDWDNPAETSAYWEWKLGSKDEAADYIQGSYNANKRHKMKFDEERSLESLRLLKSGEDLPKLTTANPFYEVSLDVDVEDLIDWEKPFADQSPKVKKALTDAGLAGDPDELGQATYKRLEETLGSPKAASDALRSSGVPGARYDDYMLRLGLDRRNNPSGSRNVILYDDNLVNIDRVE